MTTKAEKILLSSDAYIILNKMINNDTLQYLSGCLSSCHFIFTYINTTAVNIKSMRYYHEELDTCLKYIKKNKEINVGFNILLYYMCELICSNDNRNFHHGNSFFNTDMFRCYLKFKFHEMHTRTYYYISNTEFELLYIKLIKNPDMLYNYLHKEIYTELDTKMFLSMCYGTLIIYFTITTEINQALFITNMKNSETFKKTTI